MLVGDWGQLVVGCLGGLEKCAMEVCSRESNGLVGNSALGFWGLMTIVSCCARGSSLIVEVEGAVCIGVLVYGVQVKRY